MLIDVDILKIEEAIDYLLLGKGEVVAVSYQLDHPMLACEPLAQGKLKCIVPEGHGLSRRSSVTVADIVKYQLIGIDPGDPYGRIMANLFAAAVFVIRQLTIRARFGSTVCALVAAGLGVAVIDEFTLAGGNWPMLRSLDIAEPALFQTYAAYRKDAALSTYATRFIAALRGEMNRLAATEPRPEN